jgi:secondary thiamine-phosphate synthase enzyme
VKITTERISVAIQADGGMQDITGEVQKRIDGAGIREGIVTVFIPGSTGSISTVEYEPGLLKDIPRAMEIIAPSNINYEHHKTWGDDNGRSHVRSTVVGPSLVVPFSNARLILGTWQQIVAINWDTRTRRREIVIQTMGE